MERSFIWNLSGGKDSTAMCLMGLERGEQIDDIVFVDTGMEFEEMYEHLERFEAYTGRKVTKLKAEKSFEYLMFDHVKGRGKYKGEKGYGWPHATRRWCTRALKLSVLSSYDKSFSTPPVHAIGYGVDEFKRYANRLNDANFRYPLVEWKITEAMALKYCYDRGFDWGGLYTHFNRVSCWCCPLQSKKDIFSLYLFHPDKWEKLKEMASRTPFPWPSGNLSDIEDLFKSFSKTTEV